MMRTVRWMATALLLVLLAATPSSGQFSEPASIQYPADVAAHSAAPSSSHISDRLMLRGGAADEGSVLSNALAAAVARALRVPAVEAEPPAAEIQSGRSASVGRRVGSIAATLVNVLASQNVIVPGSSGSEELDEYLRPPDPSSDASLLHDAREVYRDATRFETDRYDLAIDPLGLRCRLTIRLGRVLSPAGAGH